MTDIGNWICIPCGERYGRSLNRDHLSSIHVGHCDYCGAKDVPVTEPRDYGHPKLPEGAHGQ